MSHIMNGPFEVDLKIHMVVGDNVAVVTYGLPLGEYPTKEAIKAALDESLKTVRAQMEDENVRLLTRPEFLNTILHERNGGIPADMTFASPDEWDE